MVMLDFVPVRRSCSFRLRRPYDGVSLKRDEQYDVARYSGYDLHHQVLGMPQRRIHLDVFNLFNSGCTNFDNPF